MSSNFKMEYNTIKSMLIVEQDGKPVSKYSQFSRCESIPFWKWYKDVSGYCLNEANGMYSMRFIGGLILGKVLEKEMNSTNGCCRFLFEPELITGENRMQLVEELLRYSKIRARKYRIDISFDSRQKGCFDQIEMLIGNHANYQYLGLKELPIYLCAKNEISYTSHIFIISSMAEYYQIVNTSNLILPRLVILVQNDNYQFIDEFNNVFLFSCGTKNIHKLIMAWISDVIFPEYVRSLINEFKSCHKWNTIDYQSAKKMIDALCSNTPYLDLSITEKIEMNSVGKFTLKKYPKDISCRMYSSNAKVALLGNGGVIKPTGEGSAEIVAEIKDYPTIRISKRITVFKYKIVQRINLNTTNTNIVVGDKLIVTYDCIPRDANNISLGRWEIIPNDCLKMVSNKPGVFRALKPGKCKLTYRVGNVQESLLIVVSPKPASIDFVEKSISVKLNDTSQRVITVVYPQGARGGSIKYKISNTSVLDLDSNNGQIIPKREGVSVITAILLDNNGMIIDDCNCNITVLPPKDVVTPNGALVLLMVSLIGSLLLINNDCRYLCGIIGCIGAIWYSITEKSNKAYITSIILFLAIIFIICIGRVVSDY